LTYTEWFEAHAKKHKAIIDKLLIQNLSNEQIIEYFEFSNMLVSEKEFCPLYTDAKKCHDIEYLNCYFCACPHFRFNDKGISKENEKTKYSFCAIDSKDGKLGVYGDAMHQDCSNCNIPHTKKYVTKHFNLSWSQAMRECLL
jgi:Zn-finger protein